MSIYTKFKNPAIVWVGETKPTKYTRPLLRSSPVQEEKGVIKKMVGIVGIDNRKVVLQLCFDNRKIFYKVNKVFNVNPPFPDPLILPITISYQ